MKKAFNTSIDADVLQSFRDKCKEENLPINIRKVYARIRRR